MPLTEILLLAGLALAIGILPGYERARSLRGWLVLAASVVCLFWLQPSTPIRGLDFWLPTATLALTVLAWLLTTPPAERWTRANALSAGLVIFIGLTRYLGPGDWLAASRPPVITAVLAGVGLLGVLLYSLAWVLHWAGAPKAALAAAIVLLIALLVVLKTPQLALLAAQGLRGLVGQKAELATALDIRWLGFSYICFRLIHTLRDRQTGRLPVADLRTFASYVIFFPSLLAGPIDRLERFQRDFDVSPGGDARGEQWTQAGRRLVLGLAKKFIIADTLALVALSPQNAPQVSGAGWMWLLLYIYALQIYFDFSGYTDIAISLGLALGVKLPENFAAPYLKPNLTQFWNAWHMSLTQWFRLTFQPAGALAARPAGEGFAGCGAVGHPDQHLLAHRPVARCDAQLCPVGAVAWAGTIRAKPLDREYAGVVRRAAVLARCAARAGGLLYTADLPLRDAGLGVVRSAHPANGAGRTARLGRWVR
jgi:D-alanyl-lipoteichoic acid acyltransferase DltB (MBOAT superfamily)